MELGKIIVLNTEYLNFIGVQLTYNAVLVSSIHQSESYLYNFIYIILFIYLIYIHIYVCIYIKSVIAVSVAEAGSYSSNWIPRPGPSICHGAALTTHTHTQKKTSPETQNASDKSYSYRMILT